MNENEVEQMMNNLIGRNGIMVYNKKYRKCVRCGNERDRVVEMYYSYRHSDIDETPRSQIINANKLIKNNISHINSNYKKSSYKKKILFENIKVIINEGNLIVNGSVEVSPFIRNINRSMIASSITFKMFCGNCGRGIFDTILYQKCSYDIFHRKLIK